MTPTTNPQPPTPDKPVKALFQLWFDEPQVNTAARIITSRLIKDYGYDKVQEAFLEAGTKSKEHWTLAYVRGILKKKAQQEAVKKNIQEAKSRAQSTKALKSNESFMSSNNSTLGLLNILEEEIKKKSQPKPDPALRKESYKKSKQQFENEIRNKGGKSI